MKDVKRDIDLSVRDFNEISVSGLGMKDVKRYID